MEISRATGERATVVHSGDQGRTFDLRPPRAVIRCRLDGIPFTAGQYHADIALNVAPGQARSLDYLAAFPLFQLLDVPATQGRYANRRWGLVQLDSVSWEAEGT